MDEGLSSLANIEVPFVLESCKNVKVTTKTPLFTLKQQSYKWSVHILDTGR